MKKILLIILALLAFINVFGQLKTTANINLDIQSSIPQNLDVYIFKEGNKILLKTLQLGAKLHENVNIVVPIESNEQSISLSFSKQGPFGKLILMPGEQLTISTDLSDPYKIFENTTYKGSKRTQEFFIFFTESLKLGKAYTQAKDNYTDVVMTGKPDTVILKHIRDSLNNLNINHQVDKGLTTNSPTILQFILSGIEVYGYNFTVSQYQSLKDKFKDDPYTLNLINTCENSTVAGNGINYEVNAVKLGSYITNFTLPNRNGKMVSLSQFKGKYVLVDMWASWCAPCREEMPYLKEALQRFNKNNFMILSVSIDEKHNSWLKAIEKDGTIAFIHVIDDKGWNSEIIKRYQIRAIPSNFLIDPSGKVIAKGLRSKDLILKLLELYKKK
ncbi:TlpA family protein disulfide reductase [Mucilaginibacter rigui]|uniref:TlpA family protein disulfide reductase n=1 Tax=Mucilaginibacter rigui TaxID=534635 RepID=A0ABR7X2U7_9SPHI|nr:TlpA disulfide reductase family protein [Mucilaginibacter rigui]MBD1384077.1 TlpA family protein disulfide reductase [Mucilaginibacter rigui]